MSIQPLPHDVVAQIKSSTAITSLNGVIMELMKNSLDAGSTKLEISVDYSRGGCVVEDDGFGILPSEFRQDGGLGKLYHSSKLNSQTPVHGGRGTFLASLGATSFLTITSHHDQHRSHNTLNMHKSEIVSRQVPAPAQQHLSHSDHGTRVTVRDLFGNMPVRVKQRALASGKQSGKEWNHLKSSVVLLLLAWPTGLAVTIRELATNQKMVVRGSPRSGPMTEISRVCSILSQSSFIVPEEKASWVSVGASTNNLLVSGTISLEPSPTKLVQFMSLDIQPILALEGQNILYDEMNKLFLNSAFGNKENADEPDALERSRRAEDARYKGNGYTIKELKGGKKGVDRWPMFYLNIQQTNTAAVPQSFNADEIFGNNANSLSAIIEVLQALVFEFLTKHHFNPKASHGQRSRKYNVTDVRQQIEQNSVLRDRNMVKFGSSLSKNGPPPKRFEIERKKFARIPNPHPDLLGTNVRMPSLRHSLSADSSFDAWPRIKAGTSKPVLHNPSSVLSAANIQRPSTAPPSMLPPSINSRALPLSTSLISSTGKIIRRPFDDVPTSSSRSKSIPVRILPTNSVQLQHTVSQDSPISLALTKDIDDDTLTWINPITKVESIVNKRTGHAVAATNHKPVASIFQTPRVSPSQTIHSDVSFVSSEPSPWLSNVLERWENPVFFQAEPSIPQLSLNGETDQVLHGHRHNCTQFDISRAFTEVSSGIQGRISKQALGNVEVIGQVDRKFILVKLQSSGISVTGSKMLVIIDQHAADERIRVENLVAELCTPRSERRTDESGIVTTTLEEGIVFEVSETDLEMLGRKRNYFAEWGICFDLPHASQNPHGQQVATGKGAKRMLTVRSLPPCIVERCKSDPKTLLDLIRMELYSNSNPSHASSTYAAPETVSKSWLKRIHSCPRGILDMINSRACRSAVMFNDVLSKDQCEVLVKRLSQTAFPFQCAHGRPSLLPLLELGALGAGRWAGEDGGSGFGAAVKKWKMDSSDE
ncbi:DNA mismatch repair MLH3 [Hyphodiscus hymeniophilus]|uniref:DNA mismatch repair MLH3 n=1 Tax=Hyphodiscus hymeniophilus TaxID=353542 RepID=A0A9P6VDD5_9HELO|nr:DNA mismatch repair MLH3 [Hyphodiscus hymeniophilus]